MHMSKKMKALSQGNEMNRALGHLCAHRLNWARRTSWGWWDDWDDTVLQTQDSKFEPWRSEPEHATSRSRRLPTILTFTRGWGRNFFFSFKPPRPGTEPRTLAWKAAVLTTTLGPPPALSQGEMKLSRLERAPLAQSSTRLPDRPPLVIWRYPKALNLQPPNYSIWIFTHLKLCLADAIHNFKWVKIIQIGQNWSQLFSNSAD